MAIQQGGGGDECFSSKQLEYEGDQIGMNASDLPTYRT